MTVTDLKLAKNVTHMNNVGYDGIDVTSRLMNIVLEMPFDQQLDLLKRLDAKGFNKTRRFARTYLKDPWVVAVDLPDNTTSDNCYIKDIGRCGMFIETKKDRKFDVGEKLTLRFQTPTGKKQYKIICRVVRFQEDGIGVKFLRRLKEAA